MRRSGVIFIVFAALLILVILTEQLYRKTTMCSVLQTELDLKPVVVEWSSMDEDANEFVLNCISRERIGRHKRNLTHQLLRPMEGQSPESRQRSEASFNEVASKGHWKHRDSGVSGPGSTLAFAQEVIAALHVLIADIKSRHRLTRIKILDIPCGDMTWMSRFLSTRDDVDYTGIDIVSTLIHSHREKFKAQKWRFYHRDVLSQGLNDTYHLIINRMMLQHLFYFDVVKFLNIFSTSNSSYLLTTSFPSVKANSELPEIQGRFRLLNLEIPPISLIPPLCYFRDGPSPNLHVMSLWQLPLQQVRDCKQSSSFEVKGTHYKWNSCVNWAL